MTEKSGLATVNQKQAAEAIGRPASFRRDNNPPRNEDGPYSIPELVRWFVQWEIERVVPDERIKNAYLENNSEREQRNSRAYSIASV